MTKQDGEIRKKLRRADELERERKEDQNISFQLFSYAQIAAKYEAVSATAFAMPHEDVEFKTLDGLTIRGWLYPVPGKGPAVIITPGFNCVKEMFVPEVAEAFQLAGITALIYDPRSTGISDGMPRNDIDPKKQAEDYHDALTFMCSLPMVDSNCIAFWGFSFAGMVSLTAAALDKRAKLVIAVCPLTDFEFGREKFPKVLAKVMRDRESQARGNAPFYLPVLTEKGENPAGFGIGTAEEDYMLIVNAKKLAPNYENRTTLQTYYKIAAWQPFGLMPLVSPTPVMILTSENDKISHAVNQLKLFDSMSEPKKSYLAPGKGHMDIFSGEDFPKLMKLQVDFIRETLGN
ncbi:MAG: hypothetical protein M1837_007514 [Sclerophora amabilis]|nr:MAG: hypothetical protein M1837_007514 [Sclerophora amabilis]